jgi:signal transduction histidine kinase
VNPPKVFTEVISIQNEIVISAKDRGTDIDPEIRERLFIIFVTKSEKGSGFGLFISNGIVEAHGGKIWAENNADGMGKMQLLVLVCR